MKKVFAFVMAAVMTLTMFAGCASTENGGTTGKPGSGTIKVGTSGPLTGDYAVYGVAVANALELAFNEINALGGLQFEVKSQDDEADKEKAVNAYNTLMDWGMQIMAGPTTSGSALATAAECVSDKVFMLTPAASDAAVIATGENIFQICFSDPNQGIASADYIKNHSLAAKVGVIYDSSSPYSSGIFDKFKAEAETVGLEIACIEAFTDSTKSDLSTQVTKCQEAGCDLVFLPIYTAEAAQVLTYANKIGYAPKFFGCDGLDGILTVEGFDPKLAEGVLLLTPFDATSDDARTKAFVESYKAKYGETPNQFAADAYDVAYAIYEACTKGGVTADMSAEQICQILVAQFTSAEFKFDGTTGEAMTWGTDGAVSKMPMAVKIENGVYVGVE